MRTRCHKPLQNDRPMFLLQTESPELNFYIYLYRPRPAKLKPWKFLGSVSKTDSSQPKLDCSKLHQDFVVAPLVPGCFVAKYLGRSWWVQSGFRAMRRKRNTWHDSDNQMGVAQKMVRIGWFFVCWCIFGPKLSTTECPYQHFQSVHVLSKPLVLLTCFWIQNYGRISSSTCPISPCHVERGASSSLT